MNDVSLMQLFSIYIALGIGYNVVSIILTQLTGKAAAPTEPLIGVVLMTALYLVVAIGGSVSPWLYAFLLIVYTGLILRFGVFQHMLNYDSEKYYSRFTWAAAFLINIFGVIILARLILAAI